MGHDTTVAVIGTGDAGGAVGAALLPVAGGTGG